MKKKLTLVLILFSAFVANAQMSWLHKNNFNGQSRFKTVGLAINGKGYIIGGRVDSSPLTYVKDVWEYDPSTDTWTQRNNFSYALVQPAFFTIGSKGYVVGGQNSSSTYVNTNSEYDPVSDSWTNKASFPVSGVGGTFQFVINGKAYVGAGARVGSNASNTVYEYNSTTDSWTSKANFPGASRVNPTGFAIGNFGYAGLGTDGNGMLYSDFYKYDPVGNSWSAIADFPGKGRLEAVCFVINGRAYVGGGARLIGSTYFSLNDFYEYDPVSDTWAPAPSIPGLPRAHPGFFTINNKGYVVGGYEYEDDEFYNMVDKFATCGDITGMEDFHGDDTQMRVNVFPNPASDLLNVNAFNASANGWHYDVTSIDGRVLLSDEAFGNSFNFSTKNFANGTYILLMKTETGQTLVSKFEINK
jgi:N-acetylneuraminic acid mutarotase